MTCVDWRDSFQARRSVGVEALLEKPPHGTQWLRRRLAFDQKSSSVVAAVSWVMSQCPPREASHPVPLAEMARSPYRRCVGRSSSKSACGKERVHSSVGPSRCSGVARVGSISPAER